MTQPLDSAASLEADPNDAVEELKTRLLHAEKLASLGKVVAGVAHELNNPLTSILAYASQLAQSVGVESRDRSEDLERVRRILESAERALKFTRDLVAYARPPTEPQESKRLHEVLEQALFFCEHEFSARAVAVERAYPSDLPPLRGAADQLTQVFVNLFTNAAHAMSGREGRLRIEVRVDSSAEVAIVDVMDTGVGIPDEHLPRIFEPFYTTKPSDEGSGLGLSLVHDIIVAHGGTIDVQTRPGRGTSFRVTLPLAPT